MADDETRVLLVKSGDLLLIGNVGRIPGSDGTQRVADFFRNNGIDVVFFTGDIDISKVSPHA